MLRTCACVAAAALIQATSLSAQDLTDEQLLQTFQSQREVFREAEKGNLGLTRGLKLITVEDTTARTGEELAASAAPDLEPLVPPGTQEPPRASGSAHTAEGGQTDGSVVFGALAPELQINLQIEFGFDSAAIDPTQLPKLEQMCRVMKESDVTLFRVIGHTDAAGTETYNKHLSELRSQEVARYLVSDCGLEATRIETVGLGEQFLANPSEPRAEENRRVEFQALG